MLAQHYKTVLRIPHQENKVDPEAFFQPSPRNQQVLLSDITLKNEDIIKIIWELKINSAPRLDGVPASLLLNCKEALALPFYIIWRHPMGDVIVWCHTKLK